MLRPSPRGPQSVSALIFHVFSTILMSIGMLWTITVVVTRVYVFHNAYIHHLQSVENEAWLRYQCEDPSFFANLGQHVTLCQHVQENVKRNAVLVALNDTMATSSLCGAVECDTLANYILNGGLHLIAMASLAALIIIMLVIPAANVIMRFIAEQTYLRDVGSMGALERGYYTQDNTTTTIMAPVREHESWLTLSAHHQSPWANETTQNTKKHV